MEPPQVVDITVTGDTGYFNVVPPEIEEKIDKATSFKLAGAEYTTAYKRGKREKTRLVRYGHFPLGLLPRIKEIAEKEGAQVILRQPEGLWDKPKIETRTEGLQERGYQDEAVFATLLHDRGVIRASTGAGKTVIGARIIDEKHLPALVIVPTIDLLLQYRDFLTKHLLVIDGVKMENFGDTDAVYPKLQFEPIGQLGAGVVDPRKVTVATIRTIAKVLDIAYESYEYGEYDDTDNTGRVCSACGITSLSGNKCSECGSKHFRTQFEDREALKEWVESIGVVIFDEVHLVAAQMAYKASNAIPAPYKYGMSASPWRDDGADLMIEAATGPVIYRVDPGRLVEEGFLVPPLVRVVPTKSWWRPAAWGRVCKKCKQQTLIYRPQCDACGCREFQSQWLECYKQEIVNNDVRNMHIAEEVKKLECSTLVLVKQIKHGERLKELIPGSEFLKGAESGARRAEVFQQSRDGEIDVIICTQIADMGLDIPSLRALVLAGGGKSSTRHLQRIGRVVRPFMNKDCGLVVDFDDGHVANWFKKHEEARRKVEADEWGEVLVVI